MAGDVALACRYIATVADLIAPFEAIDTAHLLAPDGAAWLAARGHRVTAIEPVGRFRKAAQAWRGISDHVDRRHASEGAGWVQPGNRASGVHWTWLALGRQP